MPLKASSARLCAWPARHCTGPMERRPIRTAFGVVEVRPRRRCLRPLMISFTTFHESALTVGQLPNDGRRFFGRRFFGE